MPKELKINNQGGTIEGNIETGMRLGGPVKIEGDNGLEIFSEHRGARSEDQIRHPRWAMSRSIRET